MKTIDIITGLNTYLKTGSKSIIEELLNKLDVQYREEEMKARGGNAALKRLRVANKILKQNKKDEIRTAFHKCFTEEIDGETYQIFGCQYYFVALKEKYKTTAEEHTPEEQKELGFNLGRFFNELKNANLNKVDFDIMEIKKDFENFKAEEKLWPKKVRRGRCILPIGNIDSMGFNADYFINIIEVLGPNTEFYQNEKETGTSCFKSDIGMALLCPCRLKNEVA